jgi:hypothetical protein
MRTATLLAGTFCLVGFSAAVFAQTASSPDASSSVPAEDSPCTAGERPADNGCGATPPASTSEQSKAPGAESPPPERPQSTTPISEEVAAAEADPIVCKKVKVIGSHVRKAEVCQKQSEWNAGQDAARKLMTDAERRRSPQMRPGPSAP